MTDVNLTYSVGTVSVAANGTVVTGSGGMLWTVLPNVRQWDVISIDGGDPVPIVASPTDDTHLTIPTWKGGVKTNVSYVIYQLSPLRFVGGKAMADVDAMLAALNTDGWYRYVNPAYADPTAQGLVANDGQFALKATTGEIWLMTGGVWVFQGKYGIQLSNVRTFAGTTDALLNTDNNSAVHYGNAAAVAVSIAAPSGTNFAKGWSVLVRNGGAGLLTITPTTVTINGAANIKLSKGQAARIWSDGANYFAYVAADPSALFTFLDNLSIHGADIASAATLNLETATGNFVHLTGSVGVTAITLLDGHERTVFFVAGLTMTAGANLVLGGPATIAFAANEIASFVADGSVVRLMSRNVAPTFDLAATTHAATSKATPVDADEFPIVDSAAGNVLKKLTLANLKALFLRPVNDLSDLPSNAWTTYTPTIAVTGGTLTGGTASGAYRRVGRLIVCRMSVTWTGGSVTGATLLQVGLPANVLGGIIGNGAGYNQTTAKMLNLLLGLHAVGTADVVNYDGTFPVAAPTNILWMTGFYEAAT